MVAVVPQNRADRVFEAVEPALAAVVEGQPRRLLLALAVEVVEVIGASERRHVGRGHLLRLQGAPVEASRGPPLLGLEPPQAAREHRQPPGGVWLAEAPDQRGPGGALRHLHAVDALPGLVEDFYRLVVDEGGSRRHHLEAHHPEGPPVRRRPVAAPGEDLWRHVLWGAAHGESPVGKGGGPEVAELRVAPGVQHHVLHLQVAVQDAPAVEVLEGARRAGHVEAGVRLRPEEALPAVDRVEVAPRRRLQQEEQLLVPVEAGCQLHQEGAAGRLHDRLLGHDGLLEARLHHHALGYRLQRHDLAGRGVPH
mmetsp:Transcript_13343/g.37382  ORF Transcript_13343/g.37382 Transcript_13343/m.37382 type:complete len:309 (-) Transcript_13343:147-1073(-)